MNPDCYEIIRLIIDFLARVIVPLLVIIIGHKVTINILITRQNKINDLIIDSGKEGSEAEQEFLKKTLDKVYSMPQMKWYR